MLQNLSERERNIRLILGILMLLTAAFTYIADVYKSLTSFLVIAGAALLLNYITCFCGAKKAVNIVRSKLPI